MLEKTALKLEWIWQRKTKESDEKVQMKKDKIVIEWKCKFEKIQADIRDKNLLFAQLCSILQLKQLCLQKNETMIKFQYQKWNMTNCYIYGWFGKIDHDKGGAKWDEVCHNVNYSYTEITIYDSSLIIFRKIK